MSRPQKSTINYFPHSTHHGKTMFVIESRYGNDGYAFWFKILELLGNAEGMFYDCNNVSDWEFLLAKTRVNEETANNILNTLADLDAIDKELWFNGRIIWCQNLVDNVKDAFKRRKTKLPEKPVLQPKNELLHTETPAEESFCMQKPSLTEVSASKNGEKKRKEKKRKEKKLNESEILNKPRSQIFEQNSSDLQTETHNNKDPAYEIFIRSYGRSPTIPEREFVDELIRKFGEFKTLGIMKEAKLRNFRNFRTLADAIDENGNIKPKQKEYENGVYTAQELMQKYKDCYYPGATYDPIANEYEMIDVNGELRYARKEDVIKYKLKKWNKNITRKSVMK